MNGWFCVLVFLVRVYVSNYFVWLCCYLFFWYGGVWFFVRVCCEWCVGWFVGMGRVVDVIGKGVVWFYYLGWWEWFIDWLWGSVGRGIGMEIENVLVVVVYYDWDWFGVGSLLGVGIGCGCVRFLWCVFWLLLDCVVGGGGNGLVCVLVVVWYCWGCCWVWYWCDVVVGGECVWIVWGEFY